MESAFGVDHGEISKGAVYGPGGLPRSRKLVALGRGSRKVYDKGKKVGHKVATTELSVEGLGRATGGGLGRTGHAAEKVGEKLAVHPAATGAVVAGSGAGYGAYRYQKARAKEPKKKVRKQPEAM